MLKSTKNAIKSKSIIPIIGERSNDKKVIKTKFFFLYNMAAFEHWMEKIAQIIGIA